MDRTSELACIRRFLAHLDAGTTDLAASPLRVPASEFTSADFHARERARVFRRQPGLVALSGDLREAGDYLPVEVGGIPLLLIRQADGGLRAFVNGCRHRGSPIVAERGCAEGGRLRCPFHAWTYATDGRVVATPNAAEGFASHDPDAMGLHERPCLEAEGLVFVRAEGDAPIDAGQALEGLRPDLDALDLATYHPFETRTARWQCSWKLALDTFLESYHVFSLHRETVHDWYFSVPMIHDAWGPNMRFPVARRTIEELRDRPEDEWSLPRHATVQWLIGLNALISYTRDYVLLWRFESPAPGICDARTTLYSATPIDTPEQEKRLGEAFDLQMRVTGDEDFPQQERIQSVIDSGALETLVFGRHEVAPIHFHRTPTRLVASDGAPGAPA